MPPPNIILIQLPLATSWQSSVPKNIYEWNDLVICLLHTVYDKLDSSKIIFVHWGSPLHWHSWNDYLNMEKSRLLLSSPARLPLQSVIVLIRKNPRKKHFTQKICYERGLCCLFQVQLLPLIMFFCSDQLYWLQEKHKQTEGHSHEGKSSAVYWNLFPLSICVSSYCYTLKGFKAEILYTKSESNKTCLLISSLGVSFCF